MRDKAILWEAYKILRDVCEQDGQCPNCVLYESCKDLPRAPHQIIQDMHYDLYLKPLFGGERGRGLMPRFFDFFKKFCYNIYTVKKEMRKKPMKINYERTVPITPKLYEVRPGELFRPNHADQVFMRTTCNGSDEFTSEKEAPLRKMFVDIQSAYKSEEEIDYESLVFCVDMETGKMVLLDSSLKVEKLIGELMIKER